MSDLSTYTQEQTALGKMGENTIVTAPNGAEVLVYFVPAGSNPGQAYPYVEFGFLNGEGVFQVLFIGPPVKGGSPLQVVETDDGPVVQYDIQFVSDGTPSDGQILISEAVAGDPAFPRFTFLELLEEFTPVDYGITLNGDNNPNALIGTGDDGVLSGKGGNDLLDGMGGEDELFGGKGADLMFGGGNSDFLNGNEGNDDLYGGKSNDSLFDGAGRDVLLGGADKDILNGGDDADRLIGGADADIFVFDTTKGGDRIADFEDGLDKIDLSAFGLTFDDLDASDFLF